MVLIGEKLKQRAKALGLSDAEVARRLDLSPARYGHYVKDVRQPDFATFLRICRVLETTPNSVLGFESIVPTVVGSSEEASLKREIFKIVDALGVDNLRTTRTLTTALLAMGSTEKHGGRGASQEKTIFSPMPAPVIKPTEGKAVEAVGVQPAFFAQAGNPDEDGWLKSHPFVITHDLAWGGSLDRTLDFGGGFSAGRGRGDFYRKATRVAWAAGKRHDVPRTNTVINSGGICYEHMKILFKMWKLTRKNEFDEFDNIVNLDARGAKLFEDFISKCSNFSGRDLLDYGSCLTGIRIAGQRFHADDCGNSIVMFSKNGQCVIISFPSGNIVVGNWRLLSGVILSVEMRFETKLYNDYIIGCDVDGDGGAPWVEFYGMGVDLEHPEDVHIYHGTSGLADIGAGSVDTQAVETEKGVGRAGGRIVRGA